MGIGLSSSWRRASVIFKDFNLMADYYIISQKSNMNNNTRILKDWLFDQASTQVM